MLLRDRAGFLWVGTQNGLFYLNGRSFVKHRNQGRPIALLDLLADREAEFDLLLMVSKCQCSTASKPPVATAPVAVSSLSSP